MKRYKHNLSHYHITSCNMGQLIPVANVEVLPGDSFRMQSGVLVRVTPQLKPLMHPVNVRLHHFFVPHRLVWELWGKFIAGQEATPPPQITGSGHVAGNLPDYLGVWNHAQNDYNAFSVRAYNLIYNTFYRDKDIDAVASEDSLAVKNCAWEKDRFTTARPWPEKFDAMGAITLPVGTRAPITGLGLVSPGTSGAWSIKETGATAARSITGWKSVDTAPGAGTSMFAAEEGATGYPNVYADLSDPEALDVRGLRRAFALTNYAEARARWGSEYVDYLRYIGVNPSDQRLQRPEYLGGGSQTIAFSEVLNTSDTGTGEFVGHGITAMKSNRFTRYFEEHGTLITMLSIRPKTLYVNGLNKKFSRQDVEDFWQRELEDIGPEPILNRELYAAHSDPTGTFGWGARYDTYREELSRVSGEMSQSINYDWHMGRIHATEPSLNTAFTTCAPTKRVFAEQTNHSCWLMVNNQIIARRMIKPRRASSTL